ncbi:MAG: bifunctional phosphoribosylaminoimidazolecarboxamide formyltransferase/IMP cyclohydrolase [Dehalococcoidia bacterium]|nr:bifunctional phosphoribosylaminoimidazolecarboxamide formyltransferase/IMP cyclohydrolase [Dehalococcoidia bacterium]
MRAIVSVSNKSGLVDFVRKLRDLKIDIYSTGGTKKAISAEGIEVHSVSEITGFPEILDGRVKTLHPMVHGGILARRDLPQHMAELTKNKIEPVDMVVVNLYPFVQTVAKANVSLEEALENIDIGGPTMIRAAAKNFPSVLVIVDPEDYDMILEKLSQGKVGIEERKRLAQKAFQHVAMYDTAIAQYLRGAEGFPADMTIAMKKLYDLRYGENPHQKAAIYAEQFVGQRQPGLTSVKLLHGPELSFNNFLDLQAAWSTACDFPDPTVAIVKHNNACGLCSNQDLIEAYKRALAGDPISAFGGIVACNRHMDLALASEIDKTHYDCIIAPSYDDQALDIFKRKKNLRLLSLPVWKQEGKTGNIDLRQISGGFMVQEQDYYTDEEFKPKTVSKREPTENEMRDMLFAWRAVKHIKSNGIVLAKDNTLLGMGTGQPNRVVSAELSLKRAGKEAKGSVLASDAMIPFPDTVEVAGEGGVTAVIQTGGSIRDKEVIVAADKYNMAMVLTGIRHFRH